MKLIVRSVILGAGLLGSSGAMAGATGNAAAVTEYVFRGVEQSNGAAVQGGLDYAHDSGFYVGTWVSNTSFFTVDTDAVPDGVADAGLVSYETDVYAGFTKKFGDVAVDAGLLYYYYRDATQLNTLEAYVGASFGPASIKAYYTPEYFGAVDAVTGDDEGGLYVTASAALPCSSTLTLTPQIGFSSGDGVKAFLGDEYMDYSLTLTKSLDNGLAFSFAVTGTDLDNTAFNTATGTNGDDEKIVLGLKKTFDL